MKTEVKYKSVYDMLIIGSDTPIININIARQYPLLTYGSMRIFVIISITTS